MLLDKESMRNMARGFVAVTEVVVATISGYLAGHFLDVWIKRTNPWLTVLMTLLGLVLGFYRLYRIAIQDERPGN